MSRTAPWNFIAAKSRRKRLRRRHRNRLGSIETLENRAMLAASVSMYLVGDGIGGNGITEEGYSVGNESTTATIYIYAYPEDYENGATGPVSVTLDLQGDADADDVELWYEGNKLSASGGQVTFDADFEGELLVIAKADAQIEGKENLNISFAPSASYSASGEAKLVISDQSYSVSVENNTPSNQRGSSTQDCLTCSIPATINQDGQIVLQFEVDVDAQATFLQGVSLSGTFGTNKLSDFQEISTDSSEKAKFEFILNRDDFPADVDYA